MRRLLLATLVLLAGCTSGEATVADGPCREEPRVHVAGGRSVSGEQVTTGVLVRCAGRPLAGVAVRLQGRVAHSPDLALLERGRTDDDGRVEWVLAPDQSTVLVGEADVDGAVVRSEQAMLAVETRVEVDVERVAPCRLGLEGRLVPAKPGNIIGVLAQDGSARYATLLANREGVFRGEFDFPCGKPVRLNVTSGPSRTNEQGSSWRPAYPVPDEVRTCGESDADPDPTRDGLRQEVLLPAKTARVGHGWYGWTSVTNTSDEPVTVDPQEFAWELARAGQDAVVARSGTDRIGIYDPRNEPQELQPGQVLLRPLQVPPWNCFPSGVDQSKAPPIAHLPAGKYDFALERDGWWSERVRLVVSR